MESNLMRFNLTILAPFILGLLMGCGDQSANPSPAIHVGVTYYKGFNGDSVIVLLDGRIIGKGPGFSDSLNVPSGWVFTTFAGQHQLRLEIPLEETVSDTNFWASPNEYLDFYAYFDRTRKSITYEVHSRHLGD